MTCPQINGSLSHDKNGAVYLDGDRILFKRVRLFPDNQEETTDKGKKKNGIPIGIVVALDKDRIGYSKCRTDLDRFNTQYGLCIAIRRAQKGKKYQFTDSVLNKRVGMKEIQQAYNSIAERAQKYFKSE